MNCQIDGKMQNIKDTVLGDHQLQTLNFNDFEKGNHLIFD